MTQLLNRGANVVIDGQWGSTGKGKLAAYLAEKSDVDFATADFQPNAGHTVIIGGGKFVLKCIPAAFVNLNACLSLSPSSTINIETFLKEVHMLDDAGYRVSERLRIHPNVAIVTADDIAAERAGMTKIASTMQGTGAALARKIARQAKTAVDFDVLHPFIQDDTLDMVRAARQGATILIETAQGFDLSLNHGKQYPFVTSRDVTTANALANVAMPPQLISRVWASLRTYPIRVGHLLADNGEKLGDSGPVYPGQRELTWEEITQRSGSPAPLVERTTVTKRVRRIFEWSDAQFGRFLQHCQPTDLFLNFVNYLDWTVNEQTTIERSAAVRSFVAGVNARARYELGVDAPRVVLAGTGASHEHMAEVPSTWLTPVSA